MPTSRPAPTAPDEAWLHWLAQLEANTPQTRAVGQDLADGYALLKRRALQAAAEALHFTAEERRAVERLAAPFYSGHWDVEHQTLCLEANWSLPYTVGQCLSLDIWRNQHQELMHAGSYVPENYQPGQMFLLSRPSAI